MSEGGFVIGGKTVTLADITCPILVFVGSRDEFARPPSVVAIKDAAPKADIHFHEMRAGHFGLVVGSGAMTQSWPLVTSWVKWVMGEVEDQQCLWDRVGTYVHPIVNSHVSAERMIEALGLLQGDGVCGAVLREGQEKDSSTS